MSITATCTACGRNFVAPQQFQGKRVKCKGCGEIFQVPGSLGSYNPGDSDAETDPLAQLAAVAVSDSAPGADEESYSRSQIEVDSEDEVTEEDSAVSNLTPNVLTLGYPGSSDIDRYLPVTLIVIGFLLLASGSSTQDAKGIGWIAFSRFVFPCLLYWALTFPITLAMVRKAGRELRFAMPPNFRLRCFASYMPAFVLITWMQMAGEGLSVVQLFAGILGLAISSGILWLLFRLREENTGTTVAYGAGGFAAGAALTIALTIGLNKIAGLVVTSQHAQAAVPVSPLGEGLNWVAAPPPSIAAAHVERPISTVPLVPIAAAVPTAPQGAGVIGRFDSGSIPGVINDVIDPFSASPFVGVVRNRPSGIAVECWNTQTWERQPGTLQLPVKPPGNIVLSTDGEKLAWIAEFPRLSIQVWSFSSASVVASVDLERSDGRPQLIGFISSDSLMVDRQVVSHTSTAVIAPPAANTVNPADVAAPVVAPSPPASTDFFGELNARSRHKHLPIDPLPTPDPVAVVPVAPAPVAVVPVVPPPINPTPSDITVALHPVEQFAGHRITIVDVMTGSTVRSFELPALAMNPNIAGSVASDALQYGQNFAVSILNKRLVAAVKIDNIPSLFQLDLLTGKTLPLIKVTEIDPALSTVPTGLAYSNDGVNLAAVFENGGSGLVLAYESLTGKRIANFVYPSGPLDGYERGAFTGSAISWLDPSPYWMLYGQGIVSTQSGAHAAAADLNLSGAIQQRNLDGDRLELITTLPTGKRVSILKIDRGKLDTTIGASNN